MQRQLAKGAALVANLAVLSVDFVEEQVDTCVRARRDVRVRGSPPAPEAAVALCLGALL